MKRRNFFKNIAKGVVGAIAAPFIASAAKDVVEKEPLVRNIEPSESESMHLERQKCYTSQHNMYLGHYPSLSELEKQHPNPDYGSYATVDSSFNESYYDFYLFDKMGNPIEITQ